MTHNDTHEAKFARGRALLSRVWLLFGCAMTLSVAPCAALAQDGDMDERERDRAAAQREQRARIEREQRFVPGLNFEMYVFGVGQNATQALAGLTASLEHRVAQVDLACGLDKGQKKKLSLAGRNDIKRFFERFEETQRKVGDLPRAKQNNNLAYQEAKPLQRIISSGLFTDQSMFHKVLIATLETDQLTRLEAHERQARESDYRASVGWTLQFLDQFLGMTDDQRRRFEELLLRETQAPQQIGRLRRFVMFYQISRLPEAKLKAILDDIQWRCLEPQIARARGMNAVLEDNGFIPGDPRGSIPLAAKSTRPGPNEQLETKSRREGTTATNKD
jgi:hypothetical protein